LTQPKADLLQGTLDMLIFKALSLGPLHGYGIIQRLRQLSDELLEVEQGSLYPAVYRIEQRGWISSRWSVTETGRRAKFYTLTKKEVNNSPSKKRVGIGSHWRLQRSEKLSEETDYGMVQHSQGAAARPVSARKHLAGH
jgi:PadR family transcriptional regulator, regulatory protein PadR